MRRMRTAGRVVLLALPLLTGAFAGCSQAPGPGTVSPTIPAATVAAFTTDWTADAPRFVLALPGGLPPGFRVVLSAADVARQEFTAPDLHARGGDRYDFTPEEVLEPGAAYALEAFRGGTSLLRREFRVAAAVNLEPLPLAADASYTFHREDRNDEAGNRTTTTLDGTLRAELDAAARRHTLVATGTMDSQGPGMQLRFDVDTRSVDDDGHAVESRTRGNGTFQMGAGGSGTATLAGSFQRAEPKEDGDGTTRQAEVWDTVVEGRGTITEGGVAHPFQFRIATTEWRDIATRAVFWKHTETSYTVTVDGKPVAQPSEQDGPVDRLPELSDVPFRGLEPVPLVEGDAFTLTAEEVGMEEGFRATLAPAREVGGERVSVVALQGTIEGAGSGSVTAIVATSGPLAGLLVESSEDLHLRTQSLRQHRVLTSLG